MTTNQTVKSTCNFCQIGCGVLVHVKDGTVVKVEGDPWSPLNKGILCTKGLATVEYVYHPDRLKHPLKRVGERGEDKWQQISWDEAFDICETRMKKLAAEYGPDSK